MTAGARQPTSEQRPRGTAFPVTDHRKPLRAGSVTAAGLCLERPLGSRGRVWLARDADGRRWAVKSAVPALIEDEARTLAKLAHPHIVGLRGLDRIGTAPVLILEYLAGGDLVSLAGGPIAHWLDALAAIVDALGYLHGQGIVHRDLKARNVLFDGNDHARLIDFGSARPIGSAWSVGGTTTAAVVPGRGDGCVDVADDVYALAALVHELLHGGPPAKGVRRGADPEALPLAGVVDVCLASLSGASAMGLSGFRTVIELLHQRELSQQ